MGDAWDSYWEKESNRGYWLEPDRAVVELVNKLGKSKIKDALDLGCGIGRHTLYLAKAGLNVTAVDRSASALAILGQQLGEGTAVKIVEGDYSQDLFPAVSFDLILSWNVLYHGEREQVKDAIRLVYKWLRPEGLLFFTCPTRQDGKYGNGEKLAPNTYRPLNSLHPGDIHYFADESDLSDFLCDFCAVSKEVNAHFWDNNGTQQLSSYWQILARR